MNEKNTATKKALACTSRGTAFPFPHLAVSWASLETDLKARFLRVSGEAPVRDEGRSTSHSNAEPQCRSQQMTP